ncbi:tRNA lysidine(34) synthetase TilS C-terminal domain-containing protein [Candidatus Nardonella dryophthoridicola]|uniref:Lysidine-tRNA(Ile) synthetase C-terminal domain-containing protein n=1 Tax=endosymbiont of Metamasius hemipterus TaxID=204627 RepID=A0ABT0TW72_9GAMM|nr:tRNA lysidine(34) synthetase TilS C-terminal domain-containing protein [Candidatus Nardonella dryophthoridicola]MCM0158253.1 hypothetical protein [endosymbiont of Metamasius hemipterus]
MCKKNKKNNKIFINYNKIKNINNCIKFNNGYIKIFLNIKELFKLYYKYKNVNFIKLRKLKKNENIYINYYNNIEDIKYNFIGFGNKKIIELFQLLNIPIYYRNNIPLIFYNNNLMAILKFSIIKKEENINNNFIYILYKIWN